MRLESRNGISACAYSRVTSGREAGIAGGWINRARRVASVHLLASKAKILFQSSPMLMTVHFFSGGFDYQRVAKCADLRLRAIGELARGIVMIYEHHQPCAITALRPLQCLSSPFEDPTAAMGRRPMCRWMRWVYRPCPDKSQRAALDSPSRKTRSENASIINGVRAWKQLSIGLGATSLCEINSIIDRPDANCVSSQASEPE